MFEVSVVNSAREMAKHGISLTLALFGELIQTWQMILERPVMKWYEVSENTPANILRTRLRQVSGWRLSGAVLPRHHTQKENFTLSYGTLFYFTSALVYGFSEDDACSVTRNICVYWITNNCQLSKKCVVPLRYTGLPQRITWYAMFNTRMAMSAELYGTRYFKLTASVY